MNITGIIAEYNPFHNGHLYHIQKTRELTSPDLLIVIMSGSFVQRGEPSVIDKWARTEMALQGGADLVLELPVVYSCNSAPQFAYGSILALEAAHAQNFVCGAENTNLPLLKQIAELSLAEPASYKQSLHAYLDQGNSFARAHAEALKALIPAATDVIQGSNNILAINYLMACSQLDSSLKPILIQRQGNSYHDPHPTSDFASATAIRHSMPAIDQVSHALPSFSYEILKEALDQGRAPILLTAFEQVILGFLRRTTRARLAKFPDMEIGLPELLINTGHRTATLAELIENCTSSRYPRTRIQRTLIRVLLNIESDLDQQAKQLRQIPYLRVLGLRQAKSSLYKQWRTTIEVPLIERPARFNPTEELTQKMWDLDLRSTEMYRLALPRSPSSQKRDYTQHLIIV